MKRDNGAEDRTHGAFCMLKSVAVTNWIMIAGLSACPLIVSPGASAATAPAFGRGANMNQAVMQSLQACKRNTDNCRTAINHSWAVLVFPRVEKSDLGAGGAGAKGALVEDGHVTGYYTLGGGPAVPPPGIDGTSEVFVLEKDGPVARLKSGEDWNLGSTPNIKLVTEDTGYVPPTANVEAFVFDRTGLHADISLGAFDVWKTGTPRPKPQI